MPSSVIPIESLTRRTFCAGIAATVAILLCTAWLLFDMHALLGMPPAFELSSLIRAPADAITVGAGGVGCATLVLLLTLLLRRHLRDGDAIRRALFAEASAVRGREQAELQIRHMQKMEAIGQLTAGIAHDFNNMLMSIIGGTDVLERLAAADRSGADGLADDGRRAVQRIRQSSERAAALSRKLLAVSRQQAIQPRPVALGDIIDGMADLLQSALGSRTILDLKVPAHLWPVYVDPGQIEHVLLNLAINARDAMPHGGPLQITAENIAVAADSADLPVGHHVRLVVRDTGVGMTPETLARACEPFFTTKPASKGTGLGLSQVCAIINQFGGSLTLKSQPGYGTSVTILLPRSHAPAIPLTVVQPAARRPVPPAQIQPSRSLPPRSLPPRILVVDDDPLVLETLSQSLTALGYHPKIAENGNAAIDILSRDPAIAALLVDFAMPRMSGTDLAEIARSLRPTLPIIFMTGYADPESLSNEPWVLLKPFRTGEIGDMLADVLSPVADEMAPAA